MQGRSILTLSNPDSADKEGSDSIFSLLNEKGIKELVLVEDTMTGFLEAEKRSKEQGVHLIFGLRTGLCDNMSIPKKDSKDNCEHKIIIFARNDKGCKRLYNIYSSASVKGEGRIDEETLLKIWNNEDLCMGVPFYDSFIFKNTMGFNHCTPNLQPFNPVFFIERNKLPFDQLIEDRVVEYCNSFEFETQLAKSIYYNKRDDFEALQTYKCICRRGFSRNTSLSRPNLDHFSSREFSFESFCEA
jgi:DNA polymerase III alpha subunit